MLCPTRQQNESQDFSWLSSLTNSNIIPHYLYSFTAPLMPRLRRACRARSYRRGTSSKKKLAARVYGFPQSRCHNCGEHVAHAPIVAGLLPKRSLRPAFMAFRSLNTTLRRSNSRTLLSPRGFFQKEACGPRPRILWPIVPQNSPRCKQTRPALTVGRIPLRRDERAPPSAEGPAPIQNLYSKPHKIHRP